MRITVICPFTSVLSMVIVRRVFDGLKQSERERVVMVEVQYVACYKG